MVEPVHEARRDAMSARLDEADRDHVPARLAWPVVARVEERRAVAVVAEHRWSVAIVGSPGLGKSTMADRVVERVLRTDPQRPRVLHVTATGIGSGAPFDAAEVGADVGPDVVLHVDDADRLDLVAAHEVARLVRTQGTRIVVTCRDFTTLAEPLRRLWQDDLLERIDLAPLDRAETEQLLVLALDGPVESVSIDRVHRATQGNPLYLREVVRAAIASGALDRTTSGWYWPGRIRASNSLADMYRTELAKLPGDLRDVVDIVALADPIPLSRLLRLVGDGDVDRVAALGLVTVDVETASDGTPMVRPSHPLIGEVIRTLVPIARRSRLFERANAFRADSTVGAPPAARLRAALWALECGVLPPADQLLDAAQAAVRMQEYESGIALASSALSSVDVPTRVSVAARCARAVALTFSSGRESARHDAEEAWRVARAAAAQSAAGTVEDTPAVEDALVVEAAEVLANLLQFHDDDVDLALTVVDEAMTLVGADARERLRILRLTHLGWGGRFPDVLAEVDRSRVLEAEAVPFGFLALAPCAVIALAVAGRVPESYALASAAFRTASANVADAPWSLGEIASVLHQVQMWAGDIPGLTTEVARQSDPFFKYDFTLELIGGGNLAIAERRWADAETAFRAACERFEVADHGGFAAYPWTRLSFALAMLGRPAEAGAALERARSIPVRGMRITAEELPSTTVVVEHLLGHPLALEHALEIAERSERTGAWLPALFALMMVYEMANAQGRDVSGTVDRIQTAARHVQTPVARAYIAHIDALERGDMAASRAARTELAEYGFPLTAAHLGRTFLTRREFEVAELAGDGRSNRQIADELGLSVRTVDAHMSRIFAKWDIHSRSELADLV
ncbi:LuxR C-terminal-related transcriptional regulator [Curtobacterium sp. RRHDQ10]|uniref:LuxR C-terminal-related transcriptional regulator n=1 Tax=Curtobacterium phyllosphaerae TaxID=3413379 RepID=UPI003BF233ED